MILITGSKGFIADHLIESLDHELVDLMGIDKKTGYNLNELEKIKWLIEQSKPETVIHLAAVSVVTGNVMQIEEDNIRATMNLLEAIKGSLVRKIIFSSSCAVYGDSKEKNKESNKLDPISYYGISKQTGEQLIKIFCKENNLSYQILRFGNVYGKGSVGVINTFIKAIKEKKKLIMYGSGYQIRDYIHVSDIVKAIKLMIPKYRNLTLNIGTGKETDIWGILKILQRKQKLDIETKEARKEDILMSKLNIERMETILKWKPEISLEKGIDLMNATDG